MDTNYRDYRNIDLPEDEEKDTDDYILDPPEDEEKDKSVYVLDLTGVSDRALLHQRIRECLPMPEWYGGNLDALYDVLTDPSFKGARIEIVGYRQLAEEMPRYWNAFVQMCRAAAEERGDLEIVLGPGQ